VTKIKLLTYMVALTVSACASSPSAPGPGYSQYHTKKVETPDGLFVVDKFALIPGQLLSVAGQVQNNTQKQWLSARFDVLLYDRSKNLIGNPSFTITDIDKGQSKTIGAAASGSYVSFVPTGKSIDSFDLKFSGGTYKVNYDFRLDSSSSENGRTFNDGRLQIEFDVTASRLAFAIQNRTQGPLKIDWDGAAYVDVLSRSHKVFHSGVKYIDKDRPQLKGIVPPGAILSERILPSDYVTYDTRAIGEWIEQPLLPQGDAALAFKNKVFSLFLPIEIDGKTVNYNFVFRIVNVTW
jgi:hypothetical protein